MSFLPPDWKRHRHAWERLPVEERLTIIAALREKRPPWATVVEKFKTFDGNHDAGVRSLVYTLAVYGPDDPFLRGEKSLDDPAVLVALRAVAEEAAQRRAERDVMGND